MASLSQDMKKEQGVIQGELCCQHPGINGKLARQTIAVQPTVQATLCGEVGKESKEQDGVEEQEGVEFQFFRVSDMMGRGMDGLRLLFTPLLPILHLISVVTAMGRSALESEERESS